MSNKAHRAFETPEQLYAWLQVNHASETELWVRIFKKATGHPSVTWEDCVVAAIRWGWIDAVRKSLDETSFLQRQTPRRARCNKTPLPTPSTPRSNARASSPSTTGCTAPGALRPGRSVWRGMATAW
jgi:hypothetical protein